MVKSSESVVKFFIRDNPHTYNHNVVARKSYSLTMQIEVPDS